MHHASALTDDNARTDHLLSPSDSRKQQSRFTQLNLWIFSVALKIRMWRRINLQLKHRRAELLPVKLVSSKRTLALHHSTDSSFNPPLSPLISSTDKCFNLAWWTIWYQLSDQTNPSQPTSLYNQLFSRAATGCCQPTPETTWRREGSKSVRGSPLRTSVETRSKPYWPSAPFVCRLTEASTTQTPETNNDKHTALHVTASQILFQRLFCLAHYADLGNWLHTTLLNYAVIQCSIFKDVWRYTVRNDITFQCTGGGTVRNTTSLVWVD